MSARWGSKASCRSGRIPPTVPAARDQREAVGEIVAWTAVEPHLHALLAGNDAEAVVLDLVQPLAAGRQLVSLGRKARRDEPGR
jgi:hypothetical protein